MEAMKAMEARLAELSRQIADLQQQIAVLRREKAGIRQQIAASKTDIKVGDRVTPEGEAGAVWEISAIRPGWKNQPVYYGRKIKKDGTPGARVLEMWQAEFKRLVVIRDA
jgi:hypothetical protein